MKDLLQAMLDAMNRKQSGFTDLQDLTSYSDGTIHITHNATNPGRTIAVIFENVDEAITYVKKF